MPHETPINSKKTGGFALFDSLVQNGTRYIFGYPGGAILPLYDELYFWEEQNLIKHILARHEQGAVHAAILATTSKGAAPFESGWWRRERVG